MRKNLRVVMALLVIMLVFASQSPAALTQAFVEGSFENRTTDKAVCMGAGGNVGKYPNPSGQVPSYFTGSAYQS